MGTSDQLEPCDGGHHSVIGVCSWPDLSWCWEAITFLSPPYLSIVPRDVPVYVSLKTPVRKGFATGVISHMKVGEESTKRVLPWNPAVSAIVGHLYLWSHQEARISSCGINSLALTCYHSMQILKVENLSPPPPPHLWPDAQVEMLNFPCNARTWWVGAFEGVQLLCLDYHAHRSSQSHECGLDSPLMCVQTTNTLGTLLQSLGLHKFPPALVPV